MPTDTLQDAIERNRRRQAELRDSRQGYTLPMRYREATPEDKPETVQYMPDASGEVLALVRVK